MEPRALPGDAGAERRERLKAYLVACLNDSIFSWSDIASPTALDKLLKVLAADVRIVLADMGKNGGRNVLSMGSQLLGQKLIGLAGRFTSGKSK